MHLKQNKYNYIVASFMIASLALIFVSIYATQRASAVIGTLTEDNFNEVKIYAASTNSPKAGATYSAVTGKFFSLIDYPVGEKQIIDGSPTRISTWPETSGYCAGSKGGTPRTKNDGLGGSFSYGSYTALPYPVEFKDRNGNRFMGEDRTQNGCSMTSFVSLESKNTNITDTIRPLFDFNSSIKPSFFSSSIGGLSGEDSMDKGRGTYINPKAYDGWATKISGYNNPEFGSVYTDTQAAGTACPNYADHTITLINAPYSKWLIDEHYGYYGGASTGTKLFDLTSVSLGVWPTNCKDTRDYMQEIFSRRGYSNDKINQVRSNIYSKNNEINGNARLQGNGTALFRQTFNLTAADMDTINEANEYAENENVNAGVYLYMALDDYVAVYVNGRYLASNHDISVLNLIKIPMSYLREGDNLLAMEVSDKITTDTIYDKMGIGARWIVGLYAPKQFTSERYYGSWAEYSIIAPSNVDKFASAAGLARGSLMNSQAAWSNLTFSNSGSVDCRFGCYANASSLGYIPDVTGYLSKDVSGVNIIRDMGASDIHMSSANGSVYYYPNANVYIDGNIINDYNVSRNYDVTQNIIIAKNIYISGDVYRVDAWLIASGTGGGKISTCYNGECGKNSKKLIVNGAIMSRSIDLVRERFIESNKTDPAEVFNLRGDAYLWAKKVTQLNDSKYSTALVTEMPPRY